MKCGAYASNKSDKVGPVETGSYVDIGAILKVDVGPGLYLMGIVAMLKTLQLWKLVGCHVCT